MYIVLLIKKFLGLQTGDPSIPEDKEKLFTQFKYFITKIAEQKKMDVIGIFHSHPNSDAFPSSTDKKFMESNPVVWVIYSGINKNFRAHILESDSVEIQITEE